MPAKVINHVWVQIAEEGEAGTKAMNLIRFTFN